MSLRAIGVAAALLAWAGGAGCSMAQDVDPNHWIDPTHAPYQLPGQIKWVKHGDASEQAILAGDPDKPGIYVLLIRWLPHHMSRPHFHSTDRYVTVLSGTWWISTSDVYDPDRTVPIPAGSFVEDVAGKVHYDGAKDEPCVIEIAGMGPVVTKSAERKPAP
ncbi:MAG: cupin domain-containing protein [Caulobacteraceae bacterium]